MKTGQEIEDDLFEMVKSGSLAAEAAGEVYKYGTRPRDSNQEDIIVKFVEGLDGQIQEGTIAILAYIPNIDPYDDGSFIRDITRSKQLEIKAKEWVSTLTAGYSNYRFRTANTIQTFEDLDINQHFVSVKLKFRLTTF